MSFSKVYNNAVTVAMAMGHDKFVIPANNPIARGFNPKLIAVKCRKCDGLGLYLDGDCEQCKGSGVERLTPKAIRRATKTATVK